MSFIPGGAEEYDEEDDDYFDDHYQSYTNDTNYVNENTDTTAGPSNTEELKPKRDSLIEVSGSSNGLLLSDIRMAVINGNLDQLKQIIEEKTNDKFFMDTILTAGWTPVMYASNCGHKHIVEYCLERGADPNFHLNEFTPLMAVAVGNGKEEDLIVCAQHLIKFGANVNAVDKYGNSPLIYSAKSGKSGLVEELIKNGANINRPNNEGWNALHWAVREGYGKVIEKLLNNGIDVTSKTNTSQSASEIALLKGHQKINEILENIRQRVSDNTNGLQNEDIPQNRRLSEVESNILNTYVKPILEIKCREKSGSKPRVANTEELEQFLRHTNYEHLLPEFEKHNFGYHDLINNTEEVLRQIGVEDISTIRKLSSHIILLHRQEWKKDSLKDLDFDTSLTCPDVFSILSNISSHLTRIDQTILFLTNKFQQNPEILSHYNDVTAMDKVFNESLQSLINTRSLYNDLQTLKNTIQSIEDISEPQKREALSLPFTLEDELNNNCEKKQNYSKSLVLTLVSLGAVTLFVIKFGSFKRENLLPFVLQSFGKT